MRLFHLFRVHITVRTKTNTSSLSSANSTFILAVLILVTIRLLRTAVTKTTMADNWSNFDEKRSLCVFRSSPVLPLVTTRSTANLLHFYRALLYGLFLFFSCLQYSTVFF